MVFRNKRRVGQTHSTLSGEIKRDEEFREHKGIGV